VEYRNQLRLRGLSHREFLTTLVLALTFASVGRRVYALPQGEAPSTAQEDAALNRSSNQLRGLWQHGTAVERKKAAADLIAEADKLHDSNLQKARALFEASAADFPDTGQQIALVRRVLSLDEKNLGADDPQLAIDLQTLALQSNLTGNVAEAEKLYRRAANIAQGAEQMKGFERVMVLGQVGDFYARQKRYQEAEPLLRRAVELAAGLPPQQRSALFQSRTRLVELLRQEGKQDEADRLLAEPPPPATAAQAGSDLTGALNDSLRARQYKEQGNMQEAEVFYRHAIADLEMVPTAGLARAQNMVALADICHSEKRDAEAEDLYRRAFDVQEKSLTPQTAGNARVLSFMFPLQNFLRDQGRLSEIEPVYQRALATQEQYLGPDDYSLGDTLHMLASVYREEGKFDAALPLCQRALEISAKYYGENDHHVAGILNEFALNLEKLERTREAAAMRRRVAQMRGGKASLQ
jgi:tetratricopeptide (TPR) repeat protein